MKKQPLVAILIITMNKKNLILPCLESLYKNTSYKNYKVILLDNGSKDGSVNLIKKNFPQVKIIENGKNLGFARANNIGIKYAKEIYDPDYFFLLNDDTILIQKDWLNKMIEVGEAKKTAGVIGCKLIYPDGSLQCYAYKGQTYMINHGEKIPLKNKEEIVQRVRWTIGAAFLIKKSLIERIGLLDPGYYPIYGEEIDYCERTRKNGFEVWYTPFSTIIHIGSATTAANPKKILEKWLLQKKMSIRLELIQFNLGEIIYWQIIHFGSVFFKKEEGKTKFCKDFLWRLDILIKAYLWIIGQIKQIVYRRKTIRKKLWY